MRIVPGPGLLVPSRRRRLGSPLVGALALALLMIVSPMAVAAVPPVAPTHSPVALGIPLPSTARPMTGAELQQAPKARESSTTLESEPSAKIVGLPAPTSQVAFTIGFNLRDPQGLADLISAEETPGSPMFQHWISAPQENAMFGPDPTVVQNTINYYTSLGFKVSTEGPISVGFVGTAAEAASAFSTEFADVSNNGSAPALMNLGPLALPAPISASVASVNGFEGDQFQTTLNFNPTLVGLTDPSSSGAAAEEPVSQTSGPYTNESTAYNYTNHAFYWFRFFNHFYSQYENYQVITPAALDWLYDAAPLLADGYNGNMSGTQQITIAIVMGGGINPGDIKSYGEMVWNNPNALLSRITPVTVDHTSGLNGTTTYTDGTSNEMALDMEYSGTMAPGARIEPVYGPGLYTNVLDDDYATIDTLSHLPNIISNSWGGEEDGDGSLTGPTWANSQTMHYYFMLLTARGATVLASSADGGGIDQSSGVTSGSFPATDPYVLSVDGIRTTAGSSTGQIYPNPSTYGVANITEFEGVSPDVPPNYPAHVEQASELAYQQYWYSPLLNTTLFSAAPIASGGFGTSAWFNQTWYQSGIGVPWTGRALGSGVAGEADFNESIFFDGNFETGYGGTSFACPTTAGMFADIEDFLEAHGHSGYLGVGYLPVFWVANAYENGNLTLDPFFNVDNGTSYWGNRAAQDGWQWPPGQLFPRDANGHYDYGNTTTGYSFPTGWGVINAWNFAHDLEYLEDLPASVMTTGPGGTGFSYSAWENLATNQSYTFHVNATGALATDHPTMSVEFFPDTTPTLKPSEASKIVLYQNLTSVASGYTFTLATGDPSGIDVPGLLIFTLGNGSAGGLSAFTYDRVNWQIPSGGALEVRIVSPANGTIVGGQATFGAKLGLYDPPVFAYPGGINENNLALVQVTYNGKGVYDARVNATIPSPYDLAWEGTRALNVSESYGNAHTQLSDVVSTSLTNLTGYAYVWTWNVVNTTVETINAAYGDAVAQANLTVITPPNIALDDNYGGKFSYFNWIAYLLWDTRQPVTQANEQLWAPNSLDQSDYYDMGYVYAGEQLNVKVSDSAGSPLSGIKVWFGNYDTGRVTRFNDYAATDGVVGTANSSASVGVSNAYGNAQILIPQNESGNASYGLYGGPIGTWDGPAGFGAIAADIPGASNETVSNSWPCASPTSFSPVLINCVYNDSVQRNYTSLGVMVFPDPVYAWTQTPTGVHRDFFGAGTNISYGFNVSLFDNDPLINYYGWNWPSADFHVTNVTAYLDNDPTPVGTSNPEVDNLYQYYTAEGNFTVHNVSDGLHTLTVVVDTSSGQVFTYAHKFVVGSIQFNNLGIANTYTEIPYNLAWTLNIPANQINNHTFRQSLQVQYVTGGCSGVLNPCPTVVNLTEKVHDGVQYYNQSINETMLNLENFYSGAGTLPAGQYLITLWLVANHSGYVTAQLPTYLVFAPLNGTFNDPGNNEVVPLGNITVSYTYTGPYLSNATLSIFAADERAAPVFTTGIFVPAVGSTPRGGAVSWYATVVGAYQIVMDLGTPYTHTNITEWINVTLPSRVVYINTTHFETAAIGGMSAASVGTVLAIVAAVLGFLIGLFVAPAFRGAPSRDEGGPKSTKPWEEMGGAAPEAASTMPECAVCHEHFATPFALHAHQKTAHGIEE